MITPHYILTYVMESERWKYNPIALEIAGWTCTHFVFDAEIGLDALIEHLQRIDCSTGHCPHGLMYNTDICSRLPSWSHSIDEALEEYREATGENWSPGDGCLTIGSLVWFAVEWVANEIANEIYSTDEF